MATQVIFELFIAVHAADPKKKLEVFGELLFSEDDHSNWAPPCWNITTETFIWIELKSKSNCKSCQLRVLGMFIKK